MIGWMPSEADAPSWPTGQMTSRGTVRMRTSLWSFLCEAWLCGADGVARRSEHADASSVSIVWGVWV
eukprot:292428-Chlamydomonas_euryale.AAC.1